MRTDLEIAQAAKIKPITEIASMLGLKESEIELYGRYKCKIDLGAMDRLKDRRDGRLIDVTAITPPPLGEGKTVTRLGPGWSMSATARCALSSSASAGRASPARPGSTSPSPAR